MMELTIGTQQYIKVPVITLHQKNKLFYIGKVSVSSFEKIAALRPIASENIQKKYAKEKSSLIDSIVHKLNEPVLQNNEDQPFNRPGDKKRVKDITNYLLKNENALIPNAIIVGAKAKQLDGVDPNITAENLENKDWAESFNSFNGVLFHENELYIPLIEESVIIIDGQHRFLGLKGLPEELKDTYEVPLSFLVGYTPNEMAEIFYTINYEQKPVDKSLLTHLKNSFLEKVTESSIIYEYIKYLNQTEDSPLEGRIKFIKGDKGIVSLAFMQTQLLNLVEDQSTYSQKIPIFAEMFSDDENRYLVLQNLLNYFKAIKKLLDNNFDEQLWKNRTSVFTKSIGIGAFIQILPSLILKILSEKKQEQKYTNIADITIDEYYNALLPLVSVQLQEYEKGGGLGLLSKLKKEMMMLLKINHITKDFVMENKIDWISKHYIKK